jgi:predicted dehydrogenase
MNGDGRTVLLVGGGRWGRVHASNLSALLTPDDLVLWVTRHNQGAASDVVNRLPNGPRFTLLGRLEEALVLSPRAALVVTAPDSHFAVANSCLRQGIPCLVEKPLAFRGAEALSLVDLATNNGLVLAVGLHLLSATYLRQFRCQVSGRELAQIGIRWFDPAHEVRYGARKAADKRTPIIHDVYPHIWSIVRALTGCDRQVVESASQPRQDWFSFQSSASGVTVTAHCGRQAEARERKVELVFRDGGAASLDFTEEPGHATLDYAPLPPDPRWGIEPRPVMAEVRDFLAQSSSPFPDRTWPHFAENCIDSVTGAEALDLLLR